MILLIFQRRQKLVLFMPQLREKNLLLIDSVFSQFELI